MAARDSLAEEDAFFSELELDRCTRDQSQTLPHLDGNSDLAFGRDGAAHG
jgi:hypothetical protein